ncbi:hypothetical protein ICU_02060 [Bacillus cereus BAG2X1-1]|nr:hypothetical protein ICU_02060 [Bacillus cereus BAG2X1-1]
MRIRLYLRKCEKHWVSNAFLLYNGIIREEEGRLYEFKFEMDHIHNTQYFYLINFICGLWGVFVFYIVKRDEIQFIFQFENPKIEAKTLIRIKWK